MNSKGWEAQLRAMSMFWWALSLICRGCPFCSAFKGKVKEIGNFVMVLAASWRSTFEIWPNSLPKTQSPDMITLGIMVSMNNPGQLIFFYRTPLYYVTAFPPLITEKWSGHPSKSTFSINFTNYLALLHTFSP